MSRGNTEIQRAVGGFLWLPSFSLCLREHCFVWTKDQVVLSGRPGPVRVLVIHCSLTGSADKSVLSAWALKCQCRISCSGPLVKLFSSSSIIIVVVVVIIIIIIGFSRQGFSV